MPVQRDCGLTPRATILAVVVAAGLLVGCGDDANEDQEAKDAAEPPSFSYTEDGGPADWDDLDPTYAACSDGKAQSPIDLADGIPSAEPKLETDYEPGEVEQENNGHSVETLYPDGSSITLEGIEYDLDQFHFHSPSEHELDGRSFPIELHFVNLTPDESGVAVLAVFVREGDENPAFAPLAETVPDEEGEHEKVEGDVDAEDLLPPNPSTAPRWSYDGSLTTPPCTEGVHWTVFNQPIELSADQIAAYTAAYDHNSRPIQPLNGREVRFER